VFFWRDLFRGKGKFCSWECLIEVVGRWTSTLSFQSSTLQRQNCFIVPSNNAPEAAGQQLLILIYFMCKSVGGLFWLFALSRCLCAEQFSTARDSGELQVHRVRRESRYTPQSCRRPGMYLRKEPSPRIKRNWITVPAKFVVKLRRLVEEKSSPAERRTRVKEHHVIVSFVFSLNHSTFAVQTIANGLTHSIMLCENRNRELNMGTTIKYCQNSPMKTSSRASRT